jgi:hypothetical protein
MPPVNSNKEVVNRGTPARRGGTDSLRFSPRTAHRLETQPTLMSSDAGMIPIRQFDDQIGFTERFTACLHDPRDPALADHGLDGHPSDASRSRLSVTAWFSMGVRRLMRASCPMVAQRPSEDAAPP